jgi:antitoxin HicB
MSTMEVADSYLARARRYAAVVVPGAEDPFVARAVDFPGVVGAGDTPEEAEAELHNGLADMIEHLEALGRAVPEPLSTYSGTFSVRVPKSLHMALVQRARAEGVSVNAEVTLLLSQALGGRLAGVH